MRAAVEPELTAPRRELLERGALVAGNNWVERTHAQLTLEGRRMQGGWPGTIREALGLAAGLSTTLTSALTTDESAWVARIIYAHARRVWRTNA